MTLNHKEHSMATVDGARTEGLAGLQEALRGTYIGRDAPDYDEARAVYNGMIDKHPEAIVRCADTADVIAAVNYAHNRDLRVAVRSGGHNGAGLGSVDDGLVIDLSPMRGVTVDPDAKVARVQGGAQLGARPRPPPSVSFMMDEGQERVQATYGGNYERLGEVKADYDPRNFFSVNQNIQPS
jgi:FAD binding domain/Berberine and berberine like